MAILIRRSTKVLIQGMMGKEGSRACREMLIYGTVVRVGVTPGEGGKRVNGVPVYDTVQQALQKWPDVSASLVVVPAPFAKDATLEAIAVGIPLVVVLTERVPVRDCAEMVAAARSAGVQLVGPSSVGIISPGKGKIGSIGSSEIRRVFTRGPVGVISKSGGMTAEIASVLTRAGIGQSTVLGIGGDQIVGSDFVDVLRLFARDRQTRAVVLFGEIGGAYEELAAEYITKERFAKPVVALIAGEFSKQLPQGTVLGHAGAIVAQGRGGYESKVRALRKAGVRLAKTPEELPKLLRGVL